MLRLLPEAEHDILEAARWYEERDLGLGAKFVANLDAAFQKIDAGPQRYPEAHRSLRRALLSHFPYAIFFRDDGDDVLIFAVLHQRSARDVLHERQ